MIFGYQVGKWFKDDWKLHSIIPLKNIFFKKQRKYLKLEESMKKEKRKSLNFCVTIFIVKVPFYFYFTKFSQKRGCGENQIIL